MIHKIKPKILCVHLTGTGGYGERLPVDGKPDKYISHVSVRIQRKVLPTVGDDDMRVEKGGFWNAPERRVRKWLEKVLGPQDLICVAAHSWGARDWFERVHRPLLASGHFVSNRNWIGCVIADMEWAPGIFVDDKTYTPPHVDWGWNLHQPDGFGGTLIKWAFPNQKVDTKHKYIDTSLEVQNAIHAMYLAAKVELGKRS